MKPFKKNLQLFFAGMLFLSTLSTQSLHAQLFQEFFTSGIPTTTWMAHNMTQVPFPGADVPVVLQTPPTTNPFYFSTGSGGRMEINNLSDASGCVSTSSPFYRSVRAYTDLPASVPAQNNGNAWRLDFMFRFTQPNPAATPRPVGHTVLALTSSSAAITYEGDGVGDGDGGGWDDNGSGGSGNKIMGTSNPNTMTIVNSIIDVIGVNLESALVPSALTTTSSPYSLAPFAKDEGIYFGYSSTGCIANNQGVAIGNPGISVFPNTYYYLRLERLNARQIILSVHTSGAYTSATMIGQVCMDLGVIAPGSPLPAASIPSINIGGLHFLQVSNHTQGCPLRKLSGFLDNIKLHSINTVPLLSTPLVGGTPNFCAGSGASYTVNNAASFPIGTTYEWYVNGVLQSGQTSSSFYFTTANSGYYTISVKAKYACFVSTLGSMPVAVYAVPTTPIITGPTTLVCGGNATFTLSNFSASNTYKWYVNGTLQPGQTGSSFTLNQPQPGIYTISATATLSSSGCAKTGSTTLTVTTPNPAMNAAISVSYAQTPSNGTYYDISVSPVYSGSATYVNHVYTLYVQTTNGWAFLQSQTVTGANTAVLFPNINGAITFSPSHKVEHQLSFTQGCIPSSSSFQTIKLGTKPAPSNEGASTMRIGRNPSLLEFSLYPNPTSDRFVVTSNDVMETDVTVSVWNLQGTLLSEEVIYAGDKQTEIDLSNHPTGVYLVRLVGIDGTYSTLKVIKE